MTKESLKQLIREIVQEEIKQTLPTVIPQIMAEIFTGKGQQTTSTLKNEVQKQQSKIAVVEKPKKELKVYTKNEVLNKVLNETVGGVPQEGSLVAASMGPSTVSVMDHVDKVPESVSKALTRDYSSLLKAMDKKRGSTSGANLVGMM